MKNKEIGIKICSGDKIDSGLDVPKRASVIWELTLGRSPECGTEIKRWKQERDVEDRPRVSNRWTSRNRDLKEQEKSSFQQDNS